MRYISDFLVELKLKNKKKTMKSYIMVILENVILNIVKMSSHQTKQIEC